jgi:hypothetical protein
MKTKEFILVILLLVFVQTCSIAQTQVSSSLLEYRIEKIKSSKYYYIIYAKRDDLLYKIVSEKTPIPNNCEKIKKGNSYYLSLQSDLMGTNMVSRVDCRFYKNNVKICIEKRCVHNLFVTKNLSGRCLIRTN